MSQSRDNARRRAVEAWRLTTAWPAAYAKWRDERRRQSFGTKASNGCLGFLFFGIVVIFVPIMIFTVVEAAVVVYASLLSLVWGAVVVSDKLRRQPSASD